MDIPLPGELDPQLVKLTETVSLDLTSALNIPLPSPRNAQSSQPGIQENSVFTSLPPLPPDPVDDPNRYSPSRVTGDDDRDDQETEISQHHDSPLVHGVLATRGAKTTVLGKAQAKKRLLAFSMTKQGGGQGLSFGFNKKAANKMNPGSLPFAGVSIEDDPGDKIERSPKKKGMNKKGVSRNDKARAVVSAIEEIKREEMLMKGVLGYGSQMNVIGDQTYPFPLMTPSLLPPAKPRDELEMSNILSERQKGAIEELLGSLLTHDSERKSKDEERERKKGDEKKKKEAGKSSSHSKERHRSKERHGRGGRDREKEEKKHRPGDLPKNWQQFRERGFKFEEIRRLKLKLEKDKLASNNRERIRKSRDREHRSRSNEKRHKSPNNPEENKTSESDYDIMSKPFECTSRLIYPFMAVGIRQMQKQYPRSLIRFTKFHPSIPYCENPATSKAFYRTREEILCEASQRVVDLMHCVINGDLSKAYLRNEKNFKNDGNLSNSLAALQVSYDETEIDENISSSDDTSGIRRERPWYLPNNLVVWPDGCAIGVTTSSDMEMNIKRERSEETDLDNYKIKKGSSIDSSEEKETELHYLNSDREGDVKTERGDAKDPRGERTTVRSKWDSDYEEDRMPEDNNIESSRLHNVKSVNTKLEEWKGKDPEAEFDELSSKGEVQNESISKSGSDSENSTDSSSESTSANESISEDSISEKDKHLQDDEEINYKENHKVDEEMDDGNEKKLDAFTSDRESSSNSVNPENNGEGNTSLKLASEYEEFMKAVSFDSSMAEDGILEIPSSEDLSKVSNKQTKDLSPPSEITKDQNNLELEDSEASHDKLDIEPAGIDENQPLQNFTESKLAIVPKLMTSSASEDELLPAEKEEELESKIIIEDHNQCDMPKRERKQRSSSESSSTSESSYESEEVKEKEKHKKSVKASKKKRKKTVHSKKKRRKTSKKKRNETSSSSESDSSSNADSSSTSSSEDDKRKQKYRDKGRKKVSNSSSSEESQNDSTSDNASSDDHTKRKRKKKKKTRKASKKKSSKKRKRSRKESDSSDSEENIRSRRSKTFHRKSSKKESVKDDDDDDDDEHCSNDESTSLCRNSNNSNHHKDVDTHHEQSKKYSNKSKGGSREIESSHRKISKKYNKDNSSFDESFEDEDEEEEEDDEEEEEDEEVKRKKNTSKKKLNISNKKSGNYHHSETSEDEAERKVAKKRRRERRSCTTSPVVNSIKKRRRSPSTSPEHSPTPHRRNSAEGKSASHREHSKGQSSTHRKLKHGSGGSRKGHKQKEVSEDAVFSEEEYFNRMENRRDSRNMPIHENDWEVNSENEASSDSDSKVDSDNDFEDMFNESSSRRKIFEDTLSGKVIHCESIKKELCSEEERNESIERDSIDKNYDKSRHIRKYGSEEYDDENCEKRVNCNLRKQTFSSSPDLSSANKTRLYSDKYSFVQIKVEPNDGIKDNTEKDAQNSPSSPLFSLEHHGSPHQPITNRETCSTDSSQFSQTVDKVMDRYGSDISQESFKTSNEGNFTGKLFRKQSFSNLSDENILSNCVNPETPQIVPKRGTNFSLDNIPLPPILTSREESNNAHEFKDISSNVFDKMKSCSSADKITDNPSDFCESPENSIELKNQKHVISFKLSSHPCRIQPTQALKSDIGNEDIGNGSKQAHGKNVGIINENLESATKLQSMHSRTFEVFENSRAEWSTKRNPELSESQNTIISSDVIDPVVTSSSKLPDTESGSSKDEEHPIERTTRKRPSRWGMTTVPPKRKMDKELYDSLSSAKNKSLEDCKKEHTVYSEEIEKVSRKIASPVKSTLNEGNITLKKINEWDNIDDQNESWEESLDKVASSKSRSGMVHWQDSLLRRDKCSSVKIEKESADQCGSLIDWENDLDQSKIVSKVSPSTEVINTLCYSQENEMIKKTNEAQVRKLKENLSQDESGSEWESRDVKYGSQSSLLQVSEQYDSKNESVWKRQENTVGTPIARHVEFPRESNRSWNESNLFVKDLNAPKLENRRHKESLHNTRREEFDSISDVCDSRILEGESHDGAYKIIQKDVNACSKEKERLDESQATNDRFVFDASVEKERIEESVTEDVMNQSVTNVKYSEDKRSSVEKSNDYWKEDRDKKNREKRGDHTFIDNEKNKRECSERVKRSTDDKDHEETRSRKHSVEKERDRREIKDHQRLEEHSHKDYVDGENDLYREKERRECEPRSARHDDELVRKDKIDRDRSSLRERERRDRDRRGERRRDRDRERRSDRRDRDRWESEKRDRQREEKESGRRSRSPMEYRGLDQREGQREGQECSHSSSGDYWQSEWVRSSKDRDCDCTGNYYVKDIPLPLKNNMRGPGGWASGSMGENEMELSCSPGSSPLVGFKRSLADSTISDSELVSCKQEDTFHHSQDMSPSSTVYPHSQTPVKQYERKAFLKQSFVTVSPSHHPPTPVDSPAFSPKRPSLDDRIEMELGVKSTPPLSSVPQYQVYQHQQQQQQQQQPPPPPPPPQQHLPLQQSPSPTQSQQQQQTISFAQYYAHAPPPTQFENNSFLRMPPPTYRQPLDEYAPLQHLYPHHAVKPVMTRMPPPSVETPGQKRRPPLLPTPNIRPITNWDSPESFIGSQPSQSSRVVQVGNVLQVVPVEALPPPVPVQGSSQSMVLQTGNVLQVIPGDMLSNTVPSGSCIESPPVTSSSNSQVVQVGNVLQVIPGPTSSTRLSSSTAITPAKSTFPPMPIPSGSFSQNLPPLHLPPMHGPPPIGQSSILPSPTHPLPSHPPAALHGPPTHLPPPLGIPMYCPPPPHTPPMRGLHTPPIQVTTVIGLTTHTASPSQGGPHLKSPSLEMSPSSVISSPLVSTHVSFPSPVGQVTTAGGASPIPSIPVSGSSIVSSVSLSPSIIPQNIVPTPVAAPVSYSPPASPFLVPPAVHMPLATAVLPECTPVVAPQVSGDCPIPFLSSVELAQSSHMEEAEHRRAERARRRAEKEKRRKEKEKRHQSKVKQATEIILKKALEQDGEMLNCASDIDIEEMRLIEEAMQQVPEQEDEIPQSDIDQHTRRKKRKLPVENQPLPPAGKGILVSAGFREKPNEGGGTERKSVKFADGIRPGEGTSPSAGEDLPSPPPPPRKLPKEKRYKKKKKKKIKVKIIRQINVEDDDDDDDDDEDTSPPPPPPGSPPPPPMYPSGGHFPTSYPPGFSYPPTAAPFTVIPGAESSSGGATGTTTNVFTPLYHQHHHTTTTTHTTTVQFAPPHPPVTPVPPPVSNTLMFKRENKSNP